MDKTVKTFLFGILHLHLDGAKLNVDYYAHFHQSIWIDSGNVYYIRKIMVLVLIKSRMKYEKG